MRLHIKGGRVLDPANGIDAARDVFVVDGRIVAVQEPALPPPRPDGYRVIDAAGLVVVPGLIDMHTHLREPGFEYKETIRTGTLAARRGGFTSIACMANTMPVNDTRAVTEYILAKARAEGAVHVYPIGGVTKGLQGETLAEIGDLHEAGVVAISDDGQPIMNAQVMRRALEYSRAFDLLVIAHCEDLNLAQGGAMNEGIIATELGLPGIPKAAEEVMVARDIILAGLTRGRLHIAHVSTAGAVRAIRDAKAAGIRVSAEATPHHFTLSHDEVRRHTALSNIGPGLLLTPAFGHVIGGGYNTLCKVSPPLREAADVEAVRAGLADGTIDCIASDHAPHEPDSKVCEFLLAANGIVGLETTVPLTLALVHGNVLSLKDAIAKLTVNPARILGIPKGTLSVGADADITILDIEKPVTVDVTAFASKSKNSPFHGWALKGVAVHTIVSGMVH